MHRLQFHATSAIARCLAVAFAVAVVQMPAGVAQAQLMDALKGAVGAGQGESSGGVLGGGLPAVGKASPSNTAGVLQYCIQNKYIGSGGAASVKDSLLSKVTGGSQGASDSGYNAGSSGLLQTGNGQNFSLGGDGLKAQATQKVCDLVLQHAKSLL